MLDSNLGNSNPRQILDLQIDVQHGIRQIRPQRGTPSRRLGKGERSLRDRRKDSLVRCDGPDICI